MSQSYTPPEQYSPGPRVLWGRVGVALVVIVLAFTLGRCGGGDGPDDEAARLEAQVTTLQSENEELRSRVARLQEQDGQNPTDAASSEPADSGDPTEPTEPTGTDGSTATSQPTAGEGVPGGAHTVEPGDSLYTIATTVYDDRDMAQAIADANGLALDATLQVGQVLQLPEAG